MNAQPDARRQQRLLRCRSAAAIARCCSASVCVTVSEEVTMSLENGSAEARLRELNLVLPVPAKPAANYVTAVQAAGLVFLSGQGPISDGKVRFGGKIGSDLSEEDGYQAARLTAINLLANLRQELGSLDRVTRIVKLMAWVNSAPGFQR